MVSLGSKWSANSEADNPEIVEELRFLERAVSAEVPTIGVCFGAQLLARLLGSEIVDMPVPKEGWISTPLKSADLATEDLDLFYWNEQGFAAPPDAIELSVSDGYCNLFQVGSTVGAQFHADVTQDLLRRWVADVAGERTEDPRNTWLKRSDGFANTQVIAETLCGRLDHGLSAN